MELQLRPTTITRIKMIFYNLAVKAYSSLIFTASGFNTKAKLWINGRKNLFEHLQDWVFNDDRPIIWMHCASLGEFEQGRPVLEEIQFKHPDHRILLTFFSPSGFEVRKNYSGADFICYLPADTPFNAEHFVTMVKPKLTIFVKYEFWFNYIKEIKAANLPIVIISAIFRPEQHFFKWYGAWFKKQLSLINRFYVQNQSSADLLNKIGIDHVIVSGDTRFDRVKEVAKNPKQYPIIEAFKANSKILIGGSTWPPDEALLAELWKSTPDNLKLIIAPHLIDEEHLKSIEQAFPGSTLRLSKADNDSARKAKILIVDSIGHLSHIYQYGDFALIGGGFGVGTHNILEAATFGLPVFFGPNHTKFQETTELAQLGGAFPINNSTEFTKAFQDLFNNPKNQTIASKTCREYIAKNTGATEIILSGIESYL